MFFDIDFVKAHKDNVMKYMADALQWNNEQKDQYKNELEQLLHEAVHPAK